MEDKKLNDNELKNVSGGQAVLPLLSVDEYIAIDNQLEGVNRYTRCRSCGNVHALPLGSGSFKCQCGATIIY